MKFPAALTSVFLLLGLPAFALINPQVQPRHFFNDYNHAFVAKVRSLETRERLRAELEIAEVAKGDLPLGRVELVAEDREKLRDFLALTAGTQIVGFAGKDRPRNARNDGIYYVGGGKWFRFRMTEDPAVWEMIGDADEGVERGSVDIMFGVFNGSVAQLAQMVRDFAAGTAYFPAFPFTRFEAERVTKMEDPVGGVGLHDLNGDGALEILAASPAGVRIFSRKEDGSFADRTADFGLAGARGRSIDAADANGSGKSDLLIDGVLWLQGDEGFEKSDALPGLENVVSAAFVEIDGDGQPDVVVSRRDGGLTIFLNRSGEAGVKFEDATAALGLNADGAGAGCTGYFDAGDWNGNGRIDLLYLAGEGLLLLNRPEGFEPVPIGAEGSEPEFGAGAMGYLIRPGNMAAILPDAESKTLIDSTGDDLEDVTRYGNEIQDDVPGLYMAIAADLNADGNPDIFFGNRTTGSPSMFVDNRGYGSFMMPDKYAPEPTFPTEIFNSRLNGLAAGDLTGDGAKDLVAGGEDGTLWLARNVTLAKRPDESLPSTLLDARKQIAARIITVIPSTTKGVVGAQARLFDGDGRLVNTGFIGGNIGIGCARPHRIVLVTREPGPHRLEVTFADGTKVEQELDLGESSPRHQQITIAP
jgi:hypothetical protein